MKKTEYARSALIAAFPTEESFRQFNSNDNKKALRSVAAFAYRSGIIKDGRSDTLKTFIKHNALSADKCVPPASLDFEHFLDQKEELIGLDLSIRTLTHCINEFIEKNHLEWPKVSNSMLSRLKKEPADTLHKQNVLRSLSIWLGYAYPHLATHWNYETFYTLCSRVNPSLEHTEGIRIGFALFSRGEVIDQENVRWLKRVIKETIDQSIRHFSYENWGKVRSLDITTLYVDFPKETIISTPEAYRRCLRGALNLCHQICIRWVLSKHHSHSRFLSIGIAAGDFSLLPNYLHPILNAKLPADPIIRLTDYTRQCILINDIRVFCCSEPAEMTLYNGETLSIWWITGFWSTLYFDFIPDLLKDDNLGNDAVAAKRLADKLWTSPPKAESKDQNTDHRNPPNAISTFFKFPQNSLLGLEIAKTLYFRRRFWEAMEIIKTVLSIDPTNIIARTLKMMILSDLSLNAPSYDISQSLFAKAHNEAYFIQQHCAFQTEDFFCGHAMIYLAQAMLSLKYLRNKDTAVAAEGDRQQIKKNIFKYISMADVLFGMGDMVSSTGIRSYYLQKSIKVIETILKHNEAIFVDADAPLDWSLEIIRNPTKEFQWRTNYFKEANYIYPPGKLNSRIFRSDYLSHEASITLQAHRPAFYFCSAVAWWDFLPVRTVFNAKIALQLIQTAKKIANALEKKNICTYSLTRTYGEMIPAEEFSSHMDKSIKMIKEHTGDDLYRRNDDDIIENKDPNHISLLLTLNF